MTNFELVGQFMETFGQEVKYSPSIPSEDVKNLRIELIREELDELKQAIAENDLVEIADALTDILYVTYGAGHSFGLNLDECFREVQASNMSKLDSEGNPIYREDGKILKGEYYFPPNLKKVIERG